MFESIGRGRGAQRVRACRILDLDAGTGSILSQQLVHAAWHDCPTGATARRLVGAMAGRFQVERNRAGRGPPPGRARSRPPQPGAAAHIAKRQGIMMPV